MTPSESCDTIVNMTNTINNLTDEQELLRSEIVTALQESVCSVTFVKADGTERVMECTLMTHHLPAREDNGTKTKTKRTPMNIVAWDLEKGDWRSFNIKNLIRWKRKI